MQRISELQQAYIRKIMSEILFRKPLPFKSLIHLTSQKLMPNVPPTAEELRTLKDVIFNMLVEAKVNMVGGNISLNSRFRTNSVEEDYTLKINPSDEIVNVDGGVFITSVGSERFLSIWQDLEDGQIFTVNLFAEPNNRKDPNAVAICIGDKPYAYIPREYATLYQYSIMQAEAKSLLLQCTVTVRNNKDVYPIKYFELNLMPHKEIENLSI